MRCRSCLNPAAPNSEHCEQCGTAITVARRHQDSAGFAAGKRLLGEFLVQRSLGAGGMGDVYLVRSEKTGQQFAAKLARVDDEDARRDALRELEVWISLPQHPNVTACRFFRTLNDQPVIFAEYVPGSSLDRWLFDGKLRGIEAALEVAIGGAHALQVAHHNGLAHRDFKPANVLMTAGGCPKITDFGVSRWMPRIISTGGSAGATRGGYTPMYASPEQIEGRRVDHRSDIWSWGITLLEMLGQPPLGVGVGAPQWLDEFEASGQAGELGIPPPLLEILRRCFRHDPGERWSQMQELLEPLERVYAQIANQAYRPPSATPVHRERPRDAVNRSPSIRRALAGRKWLGEALALAGRPESELDRFASPQQPQTDRIAAIQELLALDEAVRIMDEIAGRRSSASVRLTFARLLRDKADVHLLAGDVPGALAACGRCVELFRSVREGDRSYRLELVEALVARGDNLCREDRHDEARECYSEGAQTAKRMADELGAREQVDTAYYSSYYLSGICCQRKGTTYRMLRRSLEAKMYLEFAVTTLQQLATRGRWPQSWRHLMNAHLELAETLAELNDWSEAEANYRLAVEAAQAQLGDRGRELADEETAAVLARKGKCHAKIGERQAAAESFDRAIDVLERLVHREGRSSLSEDLADAYMSQASVSRPVSGAQAAAAGLQPAISLLKQRVFKDGETDKREKLADVLALVADCLSEAGDSRRALDAYQEAAGLLQRLLDEGRSNLAPKLATSAAGEAAVYEATDDTANAQRSLERAEQLLCNVVGAPGALGRVPSRDALHDVAQLEYLADLTETRIALSRLSGDITYVQRAIEHLERVADVGTDRRFLDSLAGAYAANAELALRGGDAATSRGCWELAMSTWQRHVQRFNDRSKEGAIAWARAGRAAALAKLGDRRTARREAKRAVADLRSQLAGARDARQREQIQRDWLDRALQVQRSLRSWWG